MTIIDDPQIPLRLTKGKQALDPAIVIAQPTLLAAVKLAISVGGFEADKEVYGALGIDAGHWSRIHRGEAHFPLDKLPALMDLCGNEAPLIWLTHRRGYDIASLRRRETETERELRLARERIELLEHDKRVLTEALHGRIAA